MIAVLKLYAACFITLIVVDYVWLGLVMKNFYVEQLRLIGRISQDSFEPVLWAVGAVYLALSIGVVHFVLPRIAKNASWISTFTIGALLGFVVYGTYDFTNYATLKDWTLAVTLADVAWGTVLLGLVTLVARSFHDLV